MDLFTLVARLSLDASENERDARKRMQPFFDWADDALAKCERFCKEIKALDEEKARRDALMRDFERRMEDLQMSTDAKNPVSKTTATATSREALIQNIQYSLEKLTDEELERVKSYIGRLW